MRRLAIILVVFIVPLFSGTKDPGYSFSAVGGPLLSDLVGNIYTHDGTTLRKYNPQGKLTHSWTAPFGRSIGSVDVSNPFKVMVFIASDQNLNFLDNSLSVIDVPVSLGDLGMQAAAAVCSSYDNGFWVFDRWDNTLHRFNTFLTETDRSEHIDMESEGQVFLIEDGNMLYLYHSSDGLTVFDRYGTFLRHLPLTGLIFPSVNSDRFAGTWNDRICTTKLSTLVSDTSLRRYTELKGFCLTARGYALSTADSVHIFQYP